MLRNYYSKVKFLLLFAKTLAERGSNINKIVSGVQSGFLFDRVASFFCAMALLSFFIAVKRPSAEPGLAIYLAEESLEEGGGRRFFMNRLTCKLRSNRPAC